jgi:hypothetical protein
MREESSNGGAEWQLASGEGTAAAHFSVGERAMERGELQLPSALIAGGERGGDRGPTHRRQRAGGTMVRAGFPCPGSPTGETRSDFEPVTRVRKVFGPHCS